MKTILIIICIVLGIYCIYYSQARQEQKERADSLYCETLYLNLDNMSTEYSMERVRLEDTYFKNNCKDLFSNI